jgi:hypothetical protein
MFLHLKKHTAVQVEEGHPLPAGCIKSMCTLGSNDEAQTLPDCLSKKKKKNSNYYQGHSVSNDKKQKMTEVKVNYTILRNKYCEGSYN